MKFAGNLEYENQNVHTSVVRRVKHTTTEPLLHVIAGFGLPLATQCNVT
jgi:hypothetical protein